jgi:prolyl oligopeptidase
MMTNEGAPNYKLVAFDIDKLEEGKHTEIIAECGHLLEGVSLAHDKMIVKYMENIAHHAYLYDLDGNRLREIALPTAGSAGFSTDKEHKEIYYAFTSYTFPGAIYKYDMDKDESSLIFTPKVDFNPEEYVTKQLTYPSKDGTMVNMFVTHRKDIEMNGKNPVLLYGYGGFNISLTPGFSAMRIPFIQSGGIYVVANLRGGGEFGEEWHKAGTKLQKQNVFDDFIAAAEYLIKEGYTSPEHIAINGGSNGGLLVGAVVNQRPDLFRAAVPQVGVMDMLRYHTFTIGWNWASDYGRSDDSEEMFKYLIGYSPLHTIKNDGTEYPAIMVTTGDHDDRVVPAHSFKYAATLQASDTGDAPKLVRIDSKAGHGSGKPIAKVIEEQTDIYAFIMYNLGMVLE